MMAALLGQATEARPCWVWGRRGSCLPNNDHPRWPVAAGAESLCYSGNETK